ncbi:MAG: TonB-dependent receptor [Chitinophagaceae bacterium]|nr:TonB-dependent receptor [Chitinophagaceae bacterium]
MDMGRFYGKIVDATTGKPIEAVTVQLSQNKFDPETKETTENVLAIVITDKKGEFTIEKLPVMGTFTFLATAVGYTPIVDEVQFDVKPGGAPSQMMSAFDKDLGNFKMTQDIQQLEGVVVTANKSMVQMGIDRKIFNVDQSITSAGGTAVDVMRNVPSVNVDIDGNVSLRNKTPQIFVDGRPTTLSLDQIPSDQIESVEIITNPSAKFDASGGGAGILNIVLKKNRKAGYNGSVRANADSKLGAGLGGDFNVKQGKINFFGNGMYNANKSTGTQITFREDKLNNTLATFNQTGKNNNDGHFAFARAGIDYLIDNRNTLTVSGNLVNGKFDNNGLRTILRDTTIGNYFASETGKINNLSSFTFKNLGGTISFKHNFAKANKSITADANYFSSSNTGSSLSKTQYFDMTGNSKFGEGKQLMENSGTNNNLVLQTDYTDPLTENSKIEAGLRAGIRDYSSQSQNFLFNDGTGKYDPIPMLNSSFKFNDQVYAGYVTYSQKIDNFSFQLGGRIESSFYSGTLIDSNQTFQNKYPFSFFPSVFLTQKIDDKQDIQLNYSRKINRPNFFQLIPYYNFQDSLNITRGNPGLTPEFTNLLELSYSLNMKRGNNLLATLYYRNTNDLIANYTYRDVNPLNSSMDSIFVSSYINANKSSAYGLELILTNRITSWWNLTTNVNFYNNQISGDLINSDLTNSRLSWFGKLNSTFSLPKNFSIQFTADYTSKTILPPGRGGSGGRMMWGPRANANGYSDPNYGFDLAIKKDFLKDKSASVSLSVNDIFATRVYSTHSVSQFSKDVYTIQDNQSYRNPQVFKLSLNWRFGKFDTSLFKRKNMRGEQEGMQGGMQGMQGMQ